MITLDSTLAYSDELGNQIISDVVFDKNISVIFRGRGNKLVIAQGAKIGKMSASFDGDNGLLEIGNNTSVGASLWAIRVGQDSTVSIGNNVSTTGPCVISAVEGTSVVVGDDVMIASGIQLRADDGHGIYDVSSLKRVNLSESIIIKNHVWLAFEAVVLAGVTIGEGSVIGFRSLVTKDVPNNSIAAGVPARVVRKNIAWERPHLSLSTPAFRPDATGIDRTEIYWNQTLDPKELGSTSRIHRMPWVKGNLRATLGKIARKCGLR